MDITPLFSDPSIRGHALVQPLLWYGRQVRAVLRDPFPEERNAAVEVVARAVVAVALLILVPLLAVLAPMAGIGWGLKYYSRPSEQPPKTVPASLTQPQIAEKAVPPVEEIQQAVSRLQTLYNQIRNLNTREAERLFQGIEEFDQRFGQYRECDALEKPFNSVHEIARNAYVMKRARDHYNDFYRRCADSEGVIEQPGDGSCWLHACLTGLQHLNHPEANKYTHETLRPVVVDWMEQNIEQDWRLRQFVDDAMEAYRFTQEQNIAQERNNLAALFTDEVELKNELDQAKQRLEERSQAVAALTREQYFAHMRQHGAYGSHAEWYALSKIFGIQIMFWRDLPACSNRPRCLTNEYDPSIGDGPAVVHTVLSQQGNHFNSRLPQ